MKKLILLPIVALILTACTAIQGNKNQTTTAVVSLSGTQWSLADKVQGNIPTMQFLDNKVSGNAGCNSYFANVTLNEQAKTMEVGVVGSTRKSCPEMEAERNFLHLLPQANAYKLNGSVLELYKNDLLLLKFNQVK